MAKYSIGEIISVVTLAVVTAVLVLLVLSMTGTVALCGGKKAQSAASPALAAEAEMPRAAGPRRSAPKASSRSAGPNAAESNVGHAVDPKAAASNLLDMDGPEAVKAAAARDRVLYVLGQSSCPACIACKEYLASSGAADCSVFVDLNKHAAMLKDGSLPQGVSQALGRGVPCLVAYSHRSGAVMKKAEGFSPKSVQEMVDMVRGK